MASQRTIYGGTFIHSASFSKLEIVPHGKIGVDESGKIAFVIKGNEEVPDAENWRNAKLVSAGEHGFFFPGFIDTHIHASQYPNAGVFGNSTLLDWLNTYTFPLESSFADLSVASRIYNRVVARTLSHGTTTAVYHATIHVPATNLLADICQQRGQRAFVGRVCMDSLSPEYYRDADPASALADSQACIEHVRRIDPAFDLITPVITPRFAPACTTETLSALGELHRTTQVPVQTHISENHAECELACKLFPNSKTYTHIYDDHGLLTSSTILAHGIHLDPSERELIRSRDAKISHCPASNTALTSGRAKVRAMCAEGLTIGLGTDVSGGYTSSVLGETREAIFVSRHVAMEEGEEAKLTVDEALWLATRGGAKVVGLEKKIGGFEVGMDWDAQLVHLVPVADDGLGLDQKIGPVEIFGLESWDDKVAKWVYTGDDRNTMAVWVKGRLVHQREGFAF